MIVSKFKLLENGKLNHLTNILTKCFLTRSHAKLMPGANGHFKVLQRILMNTKFEHSREWSHNITWVNVLESFLKLIMELS